MTTPFSGVAPTAQIGLWTPSSPAPALFPRRTARAVTALKSLGFRVVMTPTFGGMWEVSAGEPRALAADLHELLARSDVDAVLCSSGGYSAGLVLPYLDYALIRKACKPIVGYSDCSVILWAVMAVAGLQSVHGPMLVSEFGHWEGPFERDVHSLVDCLQGVSQMLDAAPGEVTVDNPWWDKDDERPLAMQKATPWRVLRSGSASGTLLIGCAQAVVNLLGSRFCPSHRGAVLCLDFLGAGPDVYAALLNAWQLAGYLDEIAALVIARRPPVRPAASGTLDFDEITLHILGDREIPVVVDFDFGHCEPKLSLPVGRRATLRTDPPSIDVEEGQRWR